MRVNARSCWVALFVTHRHVPFTQRHPTWCAVGTALIGRSYDGISRIADATHQETTVFNLPDTASAPLIDRVTDPGAITTGSCESDKNLRARTQTAQTLKLLEEGMAPQRHLVHAGDRVYQAGDRFANLHIVNSGIYKIVTSSPDGREQVVGFKFRGDWLGFDGIAEQKHACDAIAMDTGEIWTFPYDQLIRSLDSRPVILTRLFEAMSREIAKDRDSLMSVCTLTADARVADFLRYWAEAHSSRGMRADQITLRMTRAEIGNYLGMTLESVSRALSKLARHDVIAFGDKRRREILIPDLAALSDFMQTCMPDEHLLH